MRLPDDNIGTVRDLALHRIETSKSDIKAAKILVDAGEYLKRQRFVMQVIMMIFILPKRLKQRNKLLLR
jgi:hypothetical protein